MSKKKVKPGGVDNYISRQPLKFQDQLVKIRKVIREIAPGSIETMSYFDMPGYCYEGYDYNGMFAWFSIKDLYIRLHVRPEALLSNKSLLKNYPYTKAIVSFSAEARIPITLVKKLVKASIKDMKKLSSKGE